MGNYNQRNQQVRRDQYNAEGNINQYQVRGYNQPGQQVQGSQHNAEGNINHYQGDYHHYNNRNHYVENVGGNKAGRDNVTGDNVRGNKVGIDTSGLKHIAIGYVVATLLGLLFFAGLICGGAWFVSNSLLGPGSNLLKQELYGTPANMLKQFCNHLGSGDSQGAYDVYSSHLKSQVSLDQFGTMWGGTDAGGCTSNITSTSGTSATGTIHTTHTALVDGVGFVTTHTDYNVTLVTNDGIWQIDDVQKAS